MKLGLILLFTLVFQVSCSTPSNESIYHKDEPLLTRVKRALSAEDEVSKFAISVTEIGRKIVISGVVDTDEQKQVAEQTVSEVEGVGFVENHLFVRNPLGGESY